MKSTLNRTLSAVVLLGFLAVSHVLGAPAAPAVNDPVAATAPAAGLPNPSPAAADPWQIGFSIIGWGPAMNGTVTVGGRKATVDESLSDLLDDLKGIAMFGVELRKEKFGFYAQPNWIKLESDASVGPLSSTIESKLWIVDAAGFYQLHKWGEERPVTLDALAGVRYWNVNNELTVNSSRGVVDFNGSNSAYLIDPIVGLRTQIYFTRKFSLSLHGDIGGFDASPNSSDFSWQALGLLGYDFTRHFSLSLGYRALSLDKNSMGGSNGKDLNLILHGFLLAFNFHW
jgi:opacity protein-like surface antigen